MKANELLDLKIKLKSRYKSRFFCTSRQHIIFTSQNLPNHLSLVIFLSMHKLVKPSSEKKYVDLTVSFAPDTDGDEDLPGPPVRYYFSHDTD